MFLQVSVCPQVGVCVAEGGMCGREGVCSGGACVVGGRHTQHPPWGIRRDMVNERAVRILLECILVRNTFLTGSCSINFHGCTSILNTVFTPNYDFEVVFKDLPKWETRKIVFFS